MGCTPADTSCAHRGHRGGALAKWQARTDHRPEGDTERLVSPAQSRPPTSELVELTISSSVSMEPRRLPWLPITQAGSQPSFKTLRRHASEIDRDITDRADQDARAQTVWVRACGRT